MSIQFKYDFKYQIKPRFSDIDGYGIAHHSKFFCWFEESRFYFLESILKISKDNIMDIRALIINLKAEFKKPIVFEEKYIILVTVLCDDFKPYFKFQYKVMDLEEEILYAKAETENVFVNKNGKLLLDIPEYIYEKLKLLME